LRIGEYFLNQNLISKEQLQRALSLQTNRRDFLGEILVTEEMISETDLLHYLAEQFNLQFVTSEKLETTIIQPHLSTIIPARIAEMKIIFPLRYNAGESKLTLLTYVPQDLILQDELKTVLDNVNKIVPVAALKKSIIALINKQYKGKLDAFDVMFHKKAFNINSSATATEPIQSIKAQNEQTVVANISPETAANKINTNPGFTEIINQGEMMKNENSVITIVRDIYSEDSATNEDFVETVRIFSAVLDVSKNKSFKGHSQRVHILCKKIAESIGLIQTEIEELLLAAYLHDVGKEFHVTAMDIGNGQKRELLAKYAKIPPSNINSFKYV